LKHTSYPAKRVSQARWLYDSITARKYMFLFTAFLVLVALVVTDIITGPSGLTVSEVISTIAQHREKLDAAGIPLYVDSTSDPARVLTLIRNVGLILGADEKAEELAGFVTKYTDLVDQRINRLNLAEGWKPKVFFEWHSPYETASAETSFHKPISQAGGLNIAAGQPVHTPVVSSEWVIDQNPDVIVCRVSGDATLEQMLEKYEDVVSRPGWENIEAVKNHQVHVIKSDVFLTFRYPVGLLYYATWFHPELFGDIDPEAVHREAVVTFFGEEEWEKLHQHETFVYP